MSLKEISAYKITTKLTSDLTDINQYGNEPDGVPKTPDSITQRQVSANKDGTWTENLVIEIKPIKTPLEIKSEKDKNVDGVINDYENFAVSYDKEVYDYNELINQKKAEIISIINSAENYTLVVGGLPGSCETTISAAVINSVVCGIGSTICEDRAIINTYPNINDLSTDNIFKSAEVDLAPSNFGKGFENIIIDNGGADLGYHKTISGLLKIVSSTPSPSPGELPIYIYSYVSNATCAAYRDAIPPLALEIDELRKLRSTNLIPLNKIKEDKTGEQVMRWGQKQADNDIEESKTSVKSALSHVSTFVDDIVYDKLVIFLDAAKDFTVDKKIDVSTGVNKINKWISISSDSNVGVSSPESPTYDGADGPSAWFNQYNITGKYFDLNKSYIDDNYGIVSGNVSYSLESWFKITDDSNLTGNINTGGASIVGVSSTKGIGMQVYKPSGIRIDFGSRGNGNLVSTSNLSPNIWYHVVCVREVGVNNRIYINGSLDNTSNISNLSVISSTSTMRVGFSSSNYIQQYFPGKISVVRMYSKALTDAEVSKNYLAHKSRFAAQI